MCIAFWLLETHPQFRFLLALNRDEVHSRPTQAVHWWEEENADIVGGKDCVAGGTWLASSATGRLAFVTNFREPTSIPEAKSRGNLITRFLKSSKTPMEFAQEVAQEGEEYNGFNLILMDLCSGKIAYVTNRAEGTSCSVKEVSPGMHVLSNAQLDTPWPKVQRMRCKFEELLQKFGQDEIPETQIIENIMKDTVHADRTMLPITGCDPDWEYELSPIFIETESDRGPYGTRSMVVLSLKPTGQLTFYEQYLEEGKWKEHKLTYEIKLDKLNCESKVLTDEMEGHRLVAGLSHFPAQQLVE
ncbi:hypothetical protein SUGI_0391570 [Cryptomeria japonica]|nr:hypothetical protein SUGI_0391570 [Cryptomeria japonica]